MPHMVRWAGLAIAVVMLPGGELDAQQDTARAARRRAAADSAAVDTVSRREGESQERSYRVHPRDLVGADSGICDDLCRRERMMDSLYGKDRERLPRSAAQARVGREGTPNVP